MLMTKGELCPVWMIIWILFLNKNGVNLWRKWSETDINKITLFFAFLQIQVLHFHWAPVWGALAQVWPLAGTTWGQFAHLLCSDNIKGAVKNSGTHSTFLKLIGEGSLVWFGKVNRLAMCGCFHGCSSSEDKSDVERHQGVVGEEEDLQDEEPWWSPNSANSASSAMKRWTALGQLEGPPTSWSGVYWTAMIRPPGELVGDLTSRLFLSEMRKFFFPFLS